MSDYDINVETKTTIAVFIDYDSFDLDTDQAEALLDLLADALGKTVTA